MIIDEVATPAELRESWVKATASLVQKHASLSLDLLERSIVVGLHVPFALWFYQTAIADFHVVYVATIASEVLPIVLIMTRRFSRVVSHNPADWVLAVAGSSMPLLAVPAAVPPLVPLYIWAVLWFGGMFLQISAKLTLGRGFGIVAANRGIIMAGPYQVIRHPMYAGYVLVHVALLLACPSPANAALYASAFIVQVVRLLREEEILSRDVEDRTYATSVRYRLAPGVF